MTGREGSMAQIPNNLPPRPSPFVNREQEIRAAINLLLDDRTPVVTLVGIAGIGKTTLALEIAHRLLEMEKFKGGIIWFSARNVRSSDDLVGAAEKISDISSRAAHARPDSQQRLVIVDGLDEIDPHIELEVGRLLNSFSPPNKTLVTSRKQPELKQTAIIQLGAFSEKAAMELISSLNASQGLQDPYLQKRWGIDELVHVLGYHPLALTLAARLLQGSYEEARDNLQQLLAVSDESKSDRERFTLLSSFAFLSQEQGDYSESLRLYKQALEVARQLGDHTGEANAIKAIGDLQAFLSEHDDAITSYDTAFDLFRTIGNRLGQANALKAIGDVRQFRRELDAALESYHAALELFRTVGSRLGEANTSKAIGDVQQYRKELAAALENYNAALDLFRAVGDRLGEANTLQAIGDAQRFRDEYDGALESYHTALDLFRAIGSRLGEANTLQAIGDVYQFRRELDAALESYYAALDLFRVIGDRLGEANTLKSIGDILQYRSEIDAALESYHAALDLFRAVGDRLGEANILKSIGDVQKFRREHDAALESYYVALDLFRVVGSRLGEANTLETIGDVQQFRGELDAALESYYAALDLFRAIGSRLGEANTLVAVGRLLADSQPQDAGEDYLRALAIYEQIGDSYSQARTRYNLGKMYRNQGKLERAVETFRQSRNGFRVIGLAEHPIVETVDLAFANAANELAEHYVEQGRWYDALDLLKESLAIFRQGDDLKMRADTVYQIARVHHLIGNLDKARTHYRDALRLYVYTHNQPGSAACKTGLGRLMIQTGFLDDAMRELESAEEIYKQLGDEQRVAEVREVLRIASRVKQREGL